MSRAWDIVVVLVGAFAGFVVDCYSYSMYEKGPSAGVLGGLIGALLACGYLALRKRAKA